MMKQGWEYKKLDDVALIKGRIGYRGYTKNDIVPAGEGAITLSPANITDYKISYEKCQYISWFKYEESPEIMIYNGDIIYAKTASIGKVALVKDLPEKATINPQFVVLKEIKCDNSYLYYVLRSNHFKQAISLITNGVAIPTVSQSNMGNILIPIPPIEEQKAICSLLDKMNRVIEAKKEQLKELDNLAQAIFYDMFGDPMENSKGWSMAILKDIVHKDCPISYGIVQPEDDVEDGIPIVRPVDFRDTVFVRNIGLKKTARSISDSYKRTILRGDEILFCVRGTTGTMGIATEELKGGNVTRGIVPLFFSNRMNRAFVYYSLKCPSTQSIIQEHTNGIALRQINIKDLRELPIITPPLDLQQAFAEKVEAIEQQKELINQSIKDVQTLFDAKMDYYFGE